MLIEIESIGVAGRKLKKPVEVPRPESRKAAAKAAAAGAERPEAAHGRDPKDRAFKQGIGVLAASSRGRRQ